MSVIEDMDRKTALILFSLHSFGEIRGRKRLQKILYLTNHLGWNIINDYIFYQYGPYSEWVKRQLDMLVQNDLVDEKNERGNNSKQIFIYRLTILGKKYLDAVVKFLDYNLKLKTQELYQKIYDYNTDDLEIMASLLFLRQEGVKNKNNLVEIVKSYKPRFDEKRIQKDLLIFDLLSNLSK